ncbi:MAG: hypothetical protein MZV64_63915 [Ignavibacteriales bacterium]|nr:hypothetical protein [Ignavibacteriales bacterium]
MTGVAGPGPLDREAPSLGTVGLAETELAERDGHLDGPAPVRDLRGRLPDGVPGEVLVALELAEVGVGLDAHGIDPELEAPALIVEGVDHETDVVVHDERVGVVPVHEMGPDLLRLGIETAEPDIEIVEVVGDAAIGIDGRGDVVPGLPLEGQGDLRGGGPGFFVEDAVDPDGGGGPGDVEPGGLRPAPAWPGPGPGWTRPRRRGRRWRARRGPGPGRSGGSGSWKTPCGSFLKEYSGRRRKVGAPPVKRGSA